MHWYEGCTGMGTSLALRTLPSPDGSHAFPPSSPSPAWCHTSPRASTAQAGWFDGCQEGGSIAPSASPSLWDEVGRGARRGELSAAPKPTRPKHV